MALKGRRLDILGNKKGYLCVKCYVSIKKKKKKKTKIELIPILEELLLYLRKLLFMGVLTPLILRYTYCFFFLILKLFLE